MQVMCQTKTTQRGTHRATLLREWWQGLCICVLVFASLTIHAHAASAQQSLQPLQDEASLSAAKSAAALYAQVRQEVARVTGRQPEAVAVTPLDSRLRVPDCAKGWHIAMPFAGSTTVKVRCPNLAASPQYYLRVGVQAPQTQVVLARNMHLGDVLQSEDLRLVPAPAGLAPDYTEPTQLVGRALRVSLKGGEPVQPHHLDDRVTIYTVQTPPGAGSPLSRDSVKARSVPFEQAPVGFWSGQWPDRAALKQDFPVGHVIRQSDWVQWQEVVVATQHIPRGATLSADMVALKAWPSHQMPQQAITDIERVAGQQASQEIPRGSALSSLNLRAAVLVKRGSMVMISAGSQGFAISTRVQAMQDGRLGQQIRLKNPNSGRILSGVVIASNEVRAL